MRSHSEARTAPPVHDTALLAEELARARGWAICVVILPTLTLAFLPWLPGSLEIKLLYGFSALSYVATSSWVLWRTRRGDGYTPGVFRFWGYTSAIMSAPLQYALGAFSPTPLIVTLGISFFGLGLDRDHAIRIPATAISLYLCVAVLITAGVLPDYSMYPSTGAPTLMLLFFTAMVPMVFLVGLWFARVSRNALVDAVERAAAAQRLAGQREAQLMEAERNLEQALRAGAGLSGRYSGKHAGRFTLGAVIGRGAMGEVYAGTESETGRRAAVKLLRTDINAEARTQLRFIREGKLAGGLDAPNVVSIIDVGVMDDSAPFIAMELLEGEDLASLLRRTRQLGGEQATDLVTQIARGLDAAHGARIVHRDLKPQNLFLHRSPGQEHGIWKILDFGVSKLGDSSGTLTQGGVVGTPAYMAPEQARGESVDHRCDVYALGAVLYRALTGRAPFTGGDTPSILFGVVYQMPPNPSALTDGLSSDVARVLAIALAKAPDARFSSAGELARAFGAATHRRLGGGLRTRADELLSLNPWGSQVRSGD